MITTKPTSRYVERGRAIGGFVLALAALHALPVEGCGKTPTGRVDRTTDALDQTVLGTAQSFAVLAGTTVTSTGATTVDGNLGVDPGLAVTGFPPGLVVGGTVHRGDAAALQAQSDATTAYVTLAGEAPTSDLTGKDLGGMTLTAGVYRFSSSAQLTGVLTLDAKGDPSATFVFQIGSTLTTASNASIRIINGGQECNVFWQVGSSATLGTTTAFEGNIIALASITLATGATVSGRALARTAAVTMDTNVVSILKCAGAADAGVDAGVDARGGSGGSSSSGSSGSSSGSSSSGGSSDGGTGGQDGAGTIEDAAGADVCDAQPEVAPVDFDACPTSDY